MVFITSKIILIMVLVEFFEKNAFVITKVMSQMWLGTTATK